MYKLVLLVACVVCVVNAQSDGYGYPRSYLRVKRGKYPGPPIRFYSRPPFAFPIKGPFSYTPPPFMMDDEPPYPGSRPYKVSKRPTNDGLGDDDINNLVKNLSQQDLDKILEFAFQKDKYSKSKDVDYAYNQPHKRENSQKPYSNDFYKENSDVGYQAERPYEMEFKKYINYVTQPTPVQYTQDDRRSQYLINTEPNEVKYYKQQNDGPPFKTYTSQSEPPQFKEFGSQNNGSPQLEDSSPNGRPIQLKDVGLQSSLNQYKVITSQIDRPTQFKTYGLQDEQIPDGRPESQNFINPQQLGTYPGSNNPYFTETNEEEKLPRPLNLREEDFDVSFTNNVPTVVKANSDSYQVESFGDIPLMNYNSKLHSVSSYHVPHYTITQPKPQSGPSLVPSYSSSTGLKPSPAAASIKVPFEPAPPASAAKEQSDAHLTAVKIYSHKSKGTAYTLHDDGTLTPEWPKPKYGR